MREHEHEPIRGLPGDLPAGERILWQGEPDWRALAGRAFLGRAVAAYFVALALWRGLAAYGAPGAEGAPIGFGEAMVSGLAILPVALAAFAVLGLLAYVTAKTTVYTITDRRVVLRFGVALTLCINLPFEKISSAALRKDRGGFGDIALTLEGGDKLAYAMLWPNARPWRFGRPEPMLRAVPEAERVARLLAEAAAEAATAAGRGAELGAAAAPSGRGDSRARPIGGLSGDWAAAR